MNLSEKLDALEAWQVGPQTVEALKAVARVAEEMMQREEKLSDFMPDPQLRAALDTLADLLPEEA